MRRTRENRVIKDMAMRRDRNMRDGRRMRDSRGRYMRDRGMNDMTYERDRMIRPNDYSYDYDYDYGRDYRRDYGEVEDEYYDDLEQWCKKLKKYDKFGLSKEEIINNARNMGADFKDYDEKEFVTTYYMMLSDYPEAFGNYQGYIALSKGWLEDTDAELQGSEKLTAYFYKIVQGQE